MTEYTGEDWPYEAIQEQKDAAKDGKVFVFLAGERDDVDALQEIVTSVSFLRRFGRPFHRLYHLVLRRPDANHHVFEWETPFKHRVFPVSVHRLEVLRLLVDSCDSLCFEVIYERDGEIIRESNFPAYEQGTLNATLEAALRERGWTEQKVVSKGIAPHYTSIERWLELKKKPKQGPFHRPGWLWAQWKDILDKRRKTL